VTAHPQLPGRLWTPAEALEDIAQSWPTQRSVRVYDGSFLAVDEEDVQGPDGEAFTRVVVRHHGAVGVVALDDQDRVLMLRQYRHPVERRLFELPAGILDVAGESGQQTAARELAEEAGVVARDWSPLLDMWSSPGMTDEHWQVFCARSLEAVPQSEAADLAARVHEEADLEVVWVPLQEAVRAVLERRVCDSMAVAGVLAVAAAGT
jgi:ADP-ribose pyrophosphatase